ncbi:hypothetical protein [Spirilliplanes yamanashiensis]|uniref:Peptidase M10 metallopeptidase domain-containing protein n=1 Tax=Spirilliplanes yamanashiensis TaxID=42233 RepID=A0A8J4DK48_9ACTN|nr:hypothetical protein [Spirilliplanes yamanashiensis]MDP9815720.1 hypothetical protein [Spirilliplanes yamanashiensis]GIJ03974.1 hypothetical protein Sya03_33260 [Spirilliplanes yamanashiensis]
MIGATVLALIATGLPAHATTSGAGMPTTRFLYRTHGINPVWTAYFDTGNIRWNQRVGSTIGRTTSSLNDGTAGSYAGSWYGEYIARGVQPRDRNFTIRLNSRELVADFGNNSTTLTRQSQVTATHELGHALNMADNPNTTSRSIMKYADIDDLRVEVPQPYDISEVARIY